MLRIPFRNKARKLGRAGGPGGGPQARIDRLRRMVTDLIRHERIEEKSFYLDESRGYVELLYQQAQKHGDQHKPTMQLCDYWLLEKDLIHKLFKNLIPRIGKADKPITRKFELPPVFPGKAAPMGVLELIGNDLPPIDCNRRNNLHKNLLNVLLDGARKDTTAASAADNTPSDAAAAKPAASTATKNEATTATDKTTTATDKATTATGKTTTATDKTTTATDKANTATDKATTATTATDKATTATTATDKATTTDDNLKFNLNVLLDGFSSNKLHDGTSV